MVTGPDELSYLISCFQCKQNDGLLYWLPPCVSPETGQMPDKFSGRPAETSSRCVKVLEIKNTGLYYFLPSIISSATARAKSIGEAAVKLKMFFVPVQDVKIHYV
jgi:hypothetical protein